MWTKVTPEDMAKEAKTEDLYTIAYRHSTLMIHPTFRGLSDQMQDNLKMLAILIAILRLTHETLKLQWTTFKKNGTATGKTADVMRGLYDVIAQLSTPRQEWAQ